MESRDVDKEIKLSTDSRNSPCAKVSTDQIFEVVTGGVTYHFKDQTGFNVEKWVKEINIVVDST